MPDAPAPSQADPYSATAVRLPFTDTFDDDRRAGRVIGTRVPGGPRRGGRDADSVLAVDHGALRIGYFETPGWGRHGVAYGPFVRENGLALAVFVLNGHPNAQTNPEPEHPLRTLARRVARRLLPLLPKDRVPPRPPSPYAWPPLRDNLAVGWFGAEVPPDPTAGTAFVVQATGGANGDLLVASGGTARPVVRSIQNVPAYYVVVLRERGAAFYTASLPGAAGFGAYPTMRPVGIETRGAEPQLYAGVWQGVLGEIGFHVDTRVYGVAAARPAGFDRWYGTAHAADRPAGEGLRDGRTAETGGAWCSVTDEAASRTTALLDPGVPSGLVHATFVPSDRDPYGGLAWRAQDASNHWCFEAGEDGVRLSIVQDGTRTGIASASLPRCEAGRPYALQVLDDGRRFSTFVDGKLAFDRAFEDERLGEATGTGVVLSAGDGLAGGPDAFEAHPRAVPIPPELDLGVPWTPTPETLAVEDTFDGDAPDLAGRVAPAGGRTWERVIGSGRIAVEDGSARVCASVAEPNPGRTAYALDWDDPGFADVEVVIVPPGTRQGEAERGRGGIVVWQDARNYFIVNTWLDDVYEGTSISSFFFLDGREDLYRAVWTNVGRRVTWGVPFRLRVATDGVRYLVCVDDEPVLYRALHDVYPAFTRLSIRKVGLAANWEWGDDTGSRFRRFSARSGPGLISGPSGSL